MNWLQRWLRRDRLEQELDAELQFHVDRLVTEHRDTGLSEVEARRRALRDFGAVDAVKDDCRRARGTEWLVDLIADVRIGLRVFAREPGFSSVAVTALALGLGVNTVFFSIVNTFCLSGLPYASASRLTDISIRDDTGQPRPLSPAQVRVMADLGVIDRVGYYATKPGAVRTPASAAMPGTVAYVSDDTLLLIGEAASYGRTFRPEEYRDPHAPVAIVSARLSNELFGSDAAAVGRDLILDGAVTSVVGILPRDESFPDDADVWRPLSALGLPDDAPRLTAFARLKGGGLAVQGAGPMIETALRQKGMLSSDRQRVVAVSLNDRYRGRITDPVWIAFVTAGLLVVLIACSNVSNLLLARGVRRTSEIATRLSLGATRSRIFRQLLAETLVVVIAACAGAVFVSWLGLRALSAAIPPGALPSWTRIELDWRTLSVLLGVGVVTVVLSGMAPALQLARVSGIPFNARTMSHGKGIARWSSAFLVVQLSLSVLLLCAVGITVQVYRSLANAGVPARVADVLTAEISLPERRYPTPAARAHFIEDLRRELSAASEAVSVSFAAGLPGTPGQPRSVAAGTITGAGALVGTIAVDSGYFATLGVPLLSGRELTAREVETPGSAVLVNERFARSFFGEVAVVGQRVRFTSASGGGPSAESSEVVGVVPSFRGTGAPGAPPIVYVPRPPGGAAASTILMRGAVPPQDLAPVLRQAVAHVDPDVPLSGVLPLTDATWQARWNGRVSQALITAIASVGFCLALVGVAALTAHRIATRARELSIRVALGATPSQLLRTVLGPVLTQLLLGLTFGLLLAKGWQRAFGSPIAANGNLALVVCLVSAATLMFSIWPARRAARSNPVAALRGDG